MDKSAKRYLDMYQYIASGNTLYDFLDEYIQAGDYSAETIANYFRKTINLQQPIATPQVNKPQFNALVNTYNKDIHGRIIDSMLQRTSAEEKDEILKKLQAVNPEKYNFPNLIQYIAFLEDSNFTQKAIIYDPEQDTPPVLEPEIDKLNQILVNESIKKADPELVSRIRNVFIHVILIPYARKQILKENPERDPEKNPKLKKINLLDKIFANNDAVKEYDTILEYTKTKEKEAVERAQTQASCKLRRISTMADLTGKSNLDLLRASEDPSLSLIDFISPQDKKQEKEYIPQKGDYEWGISFYKNPRVIIDEPITYSENGIENQNIVVTSFGGFKYSKKLGSRSFIDDQMQLIGVTIFGEDGNKNYFLVTPSTNLINLRNSSYREYYKKILFSDMVLDEIATKRNRLLPDMTVDEQGNASFEYDADISLMGMKGTEAVKYANRFLGNMGAQKEPATLEQLCNSEGLFRKQMELIYNLRLKSQEQDRGEY